MIQGPYIRCYRLLYREDNLSQSSHSQNSECKHHNPSSNRSSSSSSDNSESIHGDTPGWSDNEYNPFGEEAIARRKREKMISSRSSTNTSDSIDNIEHDDIKSDDEDSSDDDKSFQSYALIKSKNNYDTDDDDDNSNFGNNSSGTARNNMVSFLSSIFLYSVKKSPF